MGFVLGRKPKHETLCFLCIVNVVAAAGDEVPRVCGVCGLDPSVIASLGVLQRVDANRIAMAAWIPKQTPRITITVLV